MCAGRFASSLSVPPTRGAPRFLAQVDPCRLLAGVAEQALRLFLGRAGEVCSGRRNRPAVAVLDARWDIGGFRDLAPSAGELVWLPMRTMRHLPWIFQPDAAFALRATESSAPIGFAKRRGRHLASDQAADGEQSEQIGQHDQQGVGNGDPQRRKLELQCGRRAEQEARQHRPADPPFAEDDGGDGKVTGPAGHALGERVNVADRQEGAGQRSHETCKQHAAVPHAR
jgi:hypothetical protein